jgi:hypothetical protein
MRIAAPLTAFATGMLLLGGCAVVPAAAPPPVPALQPETVPLPPVAEQPLIWQPGHWDWNGTTYVWAPGHYVLATGHGPRWQFGYWALSNGGYTWVPAHWQ